MLKRSFRWLAFSAALAASATFFCAKSDAAIIERVVAVVGERPILLTDLRRRAKPFLAQIYGAQQQNPTQRAAAETQMYRDLLNRMIDDRLEEQAADKSRIAVTTEEIDRGMRQKAESLNLPLKDLLVEARRQGLSEQDYREEVRRQLLEGKLIQLRVLPRVRVSEEDARATYARWVKEMGEERVIELRILALRMPANATDEQAKEREDFAKDLVKKVRGGEDFCKLIAQYSEDVTTKNTCGSRGSQPTSALLPALQETAKSLKEGETSEPIAFGAEAIVIAQLNKGPHIPTYEDVRAVMRERAMGEIIERQRKIWLQDLRRGLYIDVRL
ncbi:SurA N-terminal domain-containing protein [Pendulispora rubella]|uniref:SurA N-terminal domain-containing protein n=1 Tax=Pendulispora rubella TaxID=2741070 RepID=A0ABZ2L973_9BACT